MMKPMTTSHIPDTEPSNIRAEIHRSSNKARGLHNHYQQPVSINDREKSTEAHDSVLLGSVGTKSQPFTRTRRAQSIGNNNDDNETSTSGTAGIPRQQNRPWIHRNVETYEDILLKLCDSAALVRPCRFVALTVFTRAAQGVTAQLDEVESALHFLKVEGNTKLMKVAANMQCCDPVFELQKPVFTRNTWALDETAIHPSQYDFRQLPIVSGPQHARFYAGVPLTDTRKRYRYGALAVFDAKVSSGHDDDLQMQKTLQALEVCACEAVTAMEERRKELELCTFLQSPLLLLRQSEPAMHVATDSLHSKLLNRDIDSIDRDGEMKRYHQRDFEVTKSVPCPLKVATSK